MRRQQRLRHRADFSAVYRSGNIYADGPLVLRVRNNPTLHAPRFGFAVSKRLGSAVARNRLKRQLRHAAHTSQAVGSADVIVTARDGAGGATYRQLETALFDLLDRAGLRQPGGDS